MENRATLTDQLQHDITGEFLRIAGLSPDGVLRKIFGPLLNKPTRRFAELAADFDYEISQTCISEASRIYLDRYANGFQASGEEGVPSTGSLIVVSNHPGTFDLFTVLSNIPRDDIQFIISGVPVVRSLPAASKYLIYVPSDAHGRIKVIRTAIRHLNQGGCLVLFPSGILDPDPEFMPGAELALSNWSRSLDLFLRRAPDARIQIAIVSGVIPPSALNHPLAKLAKERWKKQRLAEFLYVSGHMVRGDTFDLEPNVSFAKPMSIHDLGGIYGEKRVLEGVIDLARVQLTTHQNLYSCYTEPQ
ncbi:MAG: hypothetical protein U9R58_06475 [Chloroflexota bacterium]|nr:hypothetical protein [Chloroflexota bacterium]